MSTNKDVVLMRVEMIIRDKGMTANTFSRAIGVAQTSFSNYLTGKSRLPLELIQKILGAYPDISAEWLLRGKGQMYSDMVNCEIRDTTDIGVDNLNTLMNEIEQLKKKVNQIENERRR